MSCSWCVSIGAPFIPLKPPDISFYYTRLELDRNKGGGEKEKEAVDFLFFSFSLFLSKQKLDFSHRCLMIEFQEGTTLSPSQSLFFGFQRKTEQLKSSQLNMDNFCALFLPLLQAMVIKKGESWIKRWASSMFDRSLV